MSKDPIGSPYQAEPHRPAVSWAEHEADYVRFHPGPVHGKNTFGPDIDIDTNMDMDADLHIHIYIYIYIHLHT